MHSELKHIPFPAVTALPFLLLMQGPFALISCKYTSNGFLSPDFWTESLFPLPAQSHLPAVKEAEIGQLSP